MGQSARSLPACMYACALPPPHLHTLPFPASPSSPPFAVRRQDGLVEKHFHYLWPVAHAKLAKVRRGSALSLQ